VVIVGDVAPPPLTSTLPSGSSSAFEWYRRIFCATAPSVHWPEAGSQISAMLL